MSDCGEPGPLGTQDVAEHPLYTRRRKIAEKVMEILRAEKLSRNEAYIILDRLKYAVDNEATLGFSPVSEV